ncbi:MAG: ATP-dependent Clp protease ATP-binding subunit, partial [Gluconobacter sp.]
GGIDPALLFQVMVKQKNLGTGASARDLVRSIEDMVSESLIIARQQGAKTVRLTAGDNGVVAEISKDTEAQLGRLSH